MNNDFPLSLRFVQELLVADRDDDPILYDREVQIEGITVIMRPTNDGPITRVIVPITRDDHDSIRNLAYDIATSLLSEITNNDACDVFIRERSAHFFAHDDIPASIPDDLSVVVVDAWVEDDLT